MQKLDLLESKQKQNFEYSQRRIFWFGESWSAQDCRQSDPENWEPLATCKSEAIDSCWQ